MGLLQMADLKTKKVDLALEAGLGLGQRQSFLSSVNLKNNVKKIFLAKEKLETTQL